MVSKSNYIGRMQAVAEKQPHFGIRKLTIGATSVLLGTTLWMSGTAVTAQAAEDKEGSNSTDITAHEESNLPANNGASSATKAVVVQKSSTDVAAQTTPAKASPTEAKPNATDNANANKNAAVNTTITTKKVPANTTKLENNKKTAAPVITDSGASGQKKSHQTSVVSRSNSSTAQLNANTGTVGKQKVPTNSIQASTGIEGTRPSKDIAKTKAISDTGKVGKITVRNDRSAKLNFNLDAAALNGITVKGTSNLDKLFMTGFIQNDATTPNQSDSQNKVNDQDFANVASWTDIEQAASSGAKGVKLTANVTALGNINVNNAFTIEGAKKDDTNSAYSLSLGSNSIINNSNLTLANITVNGSILGNGQVNIAGNVTSNVDATNAKTLTNAQLTQQIGNRWSGADTHNWKAANIQAAKVNVAQGASLTINRSITGDGITQPNYGSINVGINGKLNINLKDGQTANRANEQNVSLDNANAGVRILDNGTFTTADSATVNINAGHGRAIVINEPFGGRAPVQDTILAEWENGRTGDRSVQAARHRNTMTLGNSTQMKLTGRGGILLGYTATLTTGEHSIIHIDNQGNGEGLLLDANSKVEVSPHSQLLMTSNGKDKTGSYDGGNYIGMGQDGQFRVEHDATFRYKLINAGNGMDRPWADNFNIISQNVGAHPEVYVGNDAVFDGQSDYSQFNGEIFSFSLDNGSPKNEDFFTIDGAKYVNWQRNAVVPPVPGPVGGTSPQGNLYYSMARSIIGASGKKYYIFKWNNANLNGSNYTFNDSTPDAIKQSIDNFKNSSYEWWSGIDHLATSYSRKGNAAEAPGHDVSASDITGVDTTGEKHGIPVNKFSSTPSNDTGFDPKNSQRLVLVATIIPTQVDDTQQIEDPYQVQVQYVDNLAPGQAELHQKGINGLVRTTKTTYYNVDPATGEKTIDTSKGTDGHSVTTTVLNKKQDEIIYIGKQSATIDYYYQGGDADNNAQPIRVDNQNLSATVSASPVVTNAQGDVIFNEAGDPTANTIEYNDSADIAKGKAAVQRLTGLPMDQVKVLQNDWAAAVRNKTNKYDITGLTKTAITQAAEKAGLNQTVQVGVPEKLPHYKVIIGCNKWENKAGTMTVNFLDQATKKAIATPNTALSVSVQYITNSNNGVSYNDRPQAFDNGQKITINDNQWNPQNGNFTYGYVNLPQTITNNGVKYELVKNNPVDPANAQKGDQVGGVVGTFANSYNAVINVYYQKVKTPTPVEEGSVTVTFHDDTTDTQIPDVGYNSGEKPAGTNFDYNPAGQEKELENQGYVYVKTDGTLPSDGKIPAKKIAVVIHMAHGVQPVNPGTPAKDVPKGTPEEAQPKNLAEEAVRHIHYVLDDGSGKPDAQKPPMTGLPADTIRKQTVTFTGNTYVDKITGQIVNAKQVDGKWIVDTASTAIPGINWQATNDGKFAGFDTPVVKGYNVVPTSVGEQKAVPKDDINVYVVYSKMPITQQASVTVIYHDDTADQNLPGGWTSGKEDQGTPVKYTQADINQTVADYEKKNYHYVRTDGTLPTEIPAQNVTVVVHLAHNMIPVNPNTPDKHGVNPDQLEATYTSTLHYQTKAGKTLAPDSSQSSTWTRQVTVDAVTNKVVDQGQYTTNWQLMGHSNKYNNFNVPVEIGYIAEKKTKDGAPVTTIVPGQLKVQKNLEDTVIYDQLAKMIPVDSAHQPIPGVVAVPYQNDPSDPTKVLPDEESPQVPATWRIEPKQPAGVTPDIKTNTAKVNPVDPTKPTEIIYQKTPIVEEQQATLHIVDQDANDAVLDSYTGTGKANAEINFTNYTPQVVVDWVNKGYEVVNAKNDNDSAIAASLTGTDPAKWKFGDFDNNQKIVQAFTITLKHKHTTFNPQNPGQPNEPLNPKDPTGPKVTQAMLDYQETYTATVHYEGAGKDTPVDNVQRSTWTRSITVDNVTGGILSATPWVSTDSYKNVPTPVVQGYHANKANVPAPKNERKDIINYVLYAPNGAIVPVDPDGNPIPGVKHPVFPTDPTNPTKPAVGKVPTVPGGWLPTKPNEKPGDPISPDPQHPSADVKVPFHKQETPPPVIEQQKAQVQYIDLDEHDKIMSQSPILTGKPGAKIDYSTAKSIKTYEDQGYVLVNDGFSDNPVFNDIPDQTQIFKVTFRHGQTTVTPEKPGKPGQPINPNNPNGPKYPTGTGINDLEKSGKQIIHYVGAGDQTPKDNQQDTTFTRKITFDNVTEKIIDSGTWTPANYQFTIVNTPVVQGYVADVKAAGGFKATPADPEKTYVVTYQKIGKIIPVDQNDQPIPGADQPPYKNDPTDPTKVIPDEDIPTVLGYEPKNPGQKVTPTNPTKDTKVPYVKNVAEGKIVVDYIDSDDHDAILATKALAGKMGEKITYTTSAEIKNLTNKGYVLVKDGFTDSHDHSEFTKENDNQVYQVIFKHGTIDVTSENPGKPGQPINPNDPNGPKYPNDTGENSLKVVGRQIIKYVGAGANTPKDITTETTFTRHFVIDKVTGQIINKDTAWTPAGHTFDIHQTPVVKGYVADAKEAGGFKVTPADPEKTYTVTYKQVGKIVPVGPNGQPIPGAEQPPYKNDPDDPTKIIPDEDIPTVPGYEPKNPGQKVTPTDPTKDTEVPYVQNVTEGRIVVDYIDSDDHDAILATKALTGKMGEKITYTTASEIKTLTNKGYVLVKDGYTDSEGHSEFTKENDNEVYQVIFKHGLQPVNPDHPGKPGQPINPNDPDGPKYPTGSNEVTKTVTRTIDYVDQSGKTLHAPVVQTAHFTGAGILDKVTGEWQTPIAWTGNGKLAGVTSPEIAGYQIVRVSRDSSNNVNVAPVTVNEQTKDYDVVVTYELNPKKPVIVAATGSVTYYDQTTKQDLKVVDLKGNVGEKITYTTQPTIDDYLNKGYKLVSSNFKDGDESFKKSGNKFTVVLEHGTIDVTPDHPGKPGQPINPNDPDGPKYPNDTGENSLKVVGRQVIKYVGAGSNTPKDITTETTFTRHFVIDKVTGQIINKDTAWTPASHTFDIHQTPVVKGYVANAKKAGGFKATPADPEKTYTVTYQKVGKIIPVDQNGKPIPNAPTPEYKNDQDDPTKVVPNEPVPKIPGYTPSASNITPQDPTKDTPVIYNKDKTPVAPKEPNNPEPTVPVEPVTPTQPTTPGQPVTPAPVHPEKQPSPESPRNENTTVRPLGEKDNDRTVHIEHTVIPHGEKIDKVHTVTPHGQHVEVNRNVTVPRAQSVNTVKNNSQHSELPQTGNDQQTNVAASILGGAAAAIGMIGLAGEKKRKKN